ncbi:type I DNA topoisomerase [Candidatus Erwinia haradaeae]|uniref:DNA topoisomerase 1 n=1 Tax=Candidatus Erwinia haradaeae TaxID=1922217 RepID=A0A451D9W5_9GAMM|nr:type I DNA topoisomerase [Candidatus Erwinia haradaeae]VFP83057.1 DNA topoisomerase 1 [Candidatus Erwinia haradaeae]
MGKALVIVESPAKAKTINKYLGKDYVVKSSLGHIRDLPTSSVLFREKIQCITFGTNQKIKKHEKISLFHRMGVNPFDNWEATYRILPGKEKVVSELQVLAEQADHVYLATDLDREGEAIAWHLMEVIGGDTSRYSRVVFNEITQSAIYQAFQNPGSLNIYRVHAQQARRFMDRIVGYMISPILWKKIARGLSAGRVQSVAVRLVVERERAIKSFIPAEYWDLHAALYTIAGVSLQMQVTHHLQKSLCAVNKKKIDTAISLLSKARFIVAHCIDEITNVQPREPFSTSTLQQAASIHLGFSVHQTMTMAQKLYEAGHITYIRTDSKNLSQDSIIMVRRYIKSEFGEKYLPSKEYLYTTLNNQLEAHEAIRPSDVNMLSTQLKNVKDDAKKLYHLIWRQFVACQMGPAQYHSRTLIVNAEDFKLKTKGRTLLFDGWTKVMKPRYEDYTDCQLPQLVVGSELILEKMLPSQHFTKPPSRFNEPLLVRELEKRGIGRPSTYASIISTIQDRGYVKMQDRRFYAEKIGEIVTDRLTENFSDLMNYDFTAKMEDSLDQIANNILEWKIILDDFFIKFSEKVKIAGKDDADGGMRTNQMVSTSIECSNCKQKMGIRTARTGVFLGCISYVLHPKMRCKGTVNLIPESMVSNIFEGDDVASSRDATALKGKRYCKLCGLSMDPYFMDHQRKLHVCSRNPECSGYEIEYGEFKLKGSKGPTIQCEKCGSDMPIKIGRFGKYIACINNDCKNTRKIMRNGNIAPEKIEPVPLPELICQKSDAYFVLRDGSAGVFLAAHTFPKSRETRAPQVEELQRYRDRLPKKLHYLTDAPVMDAEGNKSTVYFNRKTKKQYVATKKDGKNTGWCAYFMNGKWDESQK